jgi:hypothetical protein
MVLEIENLRQTAFGGLAKSEENPGTAGAAGTAPGTTGTVDTIIVESAVEAATSNRKAAKCEANPGAALGTAPGTAGAAKAPVDEAGMVGRPRRGAEFLRRAEGAGDERGVEPCAGKKTPALGETSLPLGGTSLRAEGHAGALPSRVADTPGPCPLNPRAFAWAYLTTASRRAALEIRSELQPAAPHRRFLWSVREPTPTARSAASQPE